MVESSHHILTSVLCESYRQNFMKLYKSYFIGVAGATATFFHDIVMNPADGEL